MAQRISKKELNASTVDILNAVRNDGSYEYQKAVPVANSEDDIPKVGRAIMGNAGIENQFLNALVNRIALVKVKSATFNNSFADLKKGYLNFGETIEEVFVQIAKAREFKPELGEQREHKRTIPDVKSAFHNINFRRQYPVTIENDELFLAFQSIDGVENLIAKIVDSVYKGFEYDEYLLFKYTIIKGVNNGLFKTVDIVDTMPARGSYFRGYSNKLMFMCKDYNKAGVTTATPREEQFIFMDAMYNAKYDVEVLASAFNMDKAEFMGHLKLVDDWTTFDNERFSEFAEAGDWRPITSEELRAMKNVRAILVDKEFFQFYDNSIKFTEKYVASGDYWNYFLNVKKTCSVSPFSNAVVFSVTE